MPIGVRRLEPISQSGLRHNLAWLTSGVTKLRINCSFRVIQFKLLVSVTDITKQVKVIMHEVKYRHSAKYCHV